MSYQDYDERYREIEEETKRKQKRQPIGENKFKEEAFKQLQYRLEKCKNWKKELWVEFTAANRGLNWGAEDSFDPEGYREYIALERTRDELLHTLKKLDTEQRVWERAIGVLETVAEELELSGETEERRYDVSGYLSRLETDVSESERKTGLETDVSESERKTGLETDVSESERKTEIEKTRTQVSVSEDNLIEAVEELENHQEEIIDCMNCYFRKTKDIGYGNRCVVYSCPILYQTIPENETEYFLEPCSGCRKDEYKHYIDLKNLVQR